MGKRSSTALEKNRTPGKYYTKNINSLRLIN